MLQDTLLNIIGKLPFSAFEVVSSAVILLFGWYFARVIGWYAANYFGRSKFYTLLLRLKWLKTGRIGRWNLSRIVEEITKWWLLLSFVAVSLAIVGFGVASRFLGKALEDFARAALSVFVLAVAALVADYFPRIVGSRFFRRARDPLFLTRVAIFAAWIWALLGVAFIVKLIPLRKVIDWGGIILVVAILAALAAEFGIIERAQKLAAKIIKRFKKPG